MRIFLCAVAVLLMMTGVASADTQSANASSSVVSATNDSPGPQVSEIPYKDTSMVLAYQFVRGDGLIVSNICNTPIGNCYMNTYWPIVGTCWCPGAYGPVAGTPGG